MHKFIYFTMDFECESDGSTNMDDESEPESDEDDTQLLLDSSVIDVDTKSLEGVADARASLRSLWNLETRL